MTTNERDQILAFMAKNRDPVTLSFNNYRMLYAMFPTRDPKDINAEVAHLENLGLVRNIASFQGIDATVVLPSGTAYLDNKRIAILEKEKFDVAAAKKARMAARRESIRWGITALIALAGLINSILARMGL